jgi:hypothetical protein
VVGLPYNDIYLCDERGDNVPVCSRRLRKSERHVMYTLRKNGPVVER